MGIYKDKREQTKQEIINAFWNLYEKSNSMKDINILSISREAGIHRGTFYIHFEDVNALINEVERELLESFDFKSIVNEAFFQEEQLQKCIQYMYKNRRYYLILLSEKGDPNFKAKVTEQFVLMICPTYYEENISVEKRFLIEYTAGGMMNATLYCLKSNNISEKMMIEMFYKLFEDMKQIVTI